ncbi:MULTISPECIES: TetR/AcrR family transcriptional regulator [unclassified Parafrankia]|uniref:TetR/AcrR family transcriptional regulator n=1 Tax=unclassified Parafrankia TaxID=2994368 RepID=UPI000DA587D3|nr:MULTISPECIES: TetR/AcrR family transcriptional regulator [unclassified Parafrankia]TCJ32208.1 TetR/AcrR family transcriptional regulator [Parafrankia sp. BMG5.11]CAI7979642.1 Transcriptional regulator, TetR family [Frankia sp. Hr75.2]SQD94079.1 Transcriptional regulator, TetR family [Parafrankia sp. Ea1.12]
MRAAVTLVAERGTTAIKVSDLAETADVSRQLMYLQFGDRDALFLEAARDLLARELLPDITQEPEGGRLRVLVTTRHFARYRSFYRAMLMGSCAFGLARILHGLVAPFGQQLVVRMSDGSLAPDLVEDFAGFVVGGWSALFASWVVDGPDPLDPEAFADRLIRMLSAVALRERPPELMITVGELD